MQSLTQEPRPTGTQAEERNLKLRPSLWMKNQCTPTKPSARLCLNRKISTSVDVSEKSMLDQSVSSKPPEVCPCCCCQYSENNAPKC